ncbi:hypothetical protein EDD98_2522 [Streptomyces sp. PanSC19]|uniref:hypothetical protein n=1 Tax=Streptomyces sp. PanSC19 TaxID=1520455 RepID=UPI000F487DD6|nr:hypothetical protein [Streptomyces sp. PanSC19]ROQ33494.1 hypothetical protein EDD98_2522 [Streptomyces sp. PanSC19]
MIYRHFNAPSRAFTQFSHDIIRHPRLSSDAVRLLTWQLSLPQGARESLSRTAERARIGATAFGRAKRQLKEEGFVHERRVQITGGRWATQQLVSSHPLTADQAAKLLAREPLASPQVTPSPRKPAAGRPTAPPTDGHPEKDPREDTSHLPPHAEHADAVEESPRIDDARALVGALPVLSPALRHIPPGMRDELARLAARWLDAGHTPTDVHEHIRHCLPADGTPVHRPGGLVRYLLRDVPPREPSRPAPVNRLSPRLEGARECAGDHIQPMLFRPVGDETHCPACASRTVSTG